MARVLLIRKLWGVGSRNIYLKNKHSKIHPSSVNKQNFVEANLKKTVLTLVVDKVVSLATVSWHMNVEQIVNK